MATVRCLYAGRSGVFFDERGERHQVFAAFEASASWFAAQNQMFPRLITVETWCERVARMPRSALIQHHANRQLPFDASDSDEMLRNRLTAGLRDEPSSSITTAPAPSVEVVASPEGSFEATEEQAEEAPDADTTEVDGEAPEALDDTEAPESTEEEATGEVSDLDTTDADTTEVEAEAPEAVDDTEAPASTDEVAAGEVSDLDTTDISPIVRAQVATLMAAVEADDYPNVFRSIKVVRDAIMPEAGIPKPKPELFELARELGRRAEEMS